MGFVFSRFSVKTKDTGFYGFPGLIALNVCFPAKADIHEDYIRGVLLVIGGCRRPGLGGAMY